MRTSLLLLTLLFFLYGCNQRSTKTESTPTDSSASASTTAITHPDTMCFRQVVGRDSTTLQLVIKDSTVTGELNVLPFEKDRAKGSIQGILANNQIRADWQRSGEGVTQSYEVVFTLKGDAVTWREGERIEKQGKWVLKNPAQGYEYVLMKTECQ
ncbi:hypothetical protein [Spirosoma validum]|uniref:Lipoprotein n=1 Tax=Spirosoma validum TaxID=2771355 RepID=A0A927B3D5_9BACT|nr:hypothetical protein [Spirosoma validum]MBD2754648.1 hypothetical protein [Spirosoma validum]